ncbi:sigma factor G inhibitor Gin [Amphibacillus sp. Q70]|uniref:sigma factor G inhibitor Gin n=1 Tax=Amphibacillus sp. Q70 TaxID=3453416 RepID=UPI003F846DA5
MNYCHICDTNQAKGIFIYDLYICESCQTKIVATDPEDPNYRFFVNKLKRIQKSPLNS